MRAPVRGRGPLCCCPCPLLIPGAAHPDVCGIFGTVAGVRASTASVLVLLNSAPRSQLGGETKDGSVSPGRADTGPPGQAAVAEWGCPSAGPAWFNCHPYAGIISAPSGMDGRVVLAVGPQCWEHPVLLCLHHPLPELPCPFLAPQLPREHCGTGRGYHRWQASPC